MDSNAELAHPEMVQMHPLSLKYESLFRLQVQFEQLLEQHVLIVDAVEQGHAALRFGA